MVGASVAPLALGDPARFAQLATLAAFGAAALFTLAWLLRLSSLIDFISETILLGFKAGAGLSIAVTQIPPSTGHSGRRAQLY
jgi:MFS superfamily sulfate permease-like transporter